MFFDLVKPTDREIKDLALREVNPRKYGQFAPIEWGFWGTLVAIVLVLICALPFVVYRCVIGWYRFALGK